MVEEEKLLHDCRHEFSAPVTGITLSTQVGRLSGSYSDIGFPLTQFPGERKAMERKGEKVGALEQFNILFTCLQKCAAAESGGRKTPGGGKSWATTMNQIESGKT